MRAQTIRQRLPNDKASSTGPLKENKQPKTQNIRKVLQPDSIKFGHEEFQALLEEITTPPSQDILTRRRHLMRYERWR